MDGRASGDGGDHESTADPWISTVTNVAAFLAGFSLASVVAISDGSDHFRWPGGAILAMTTASVVLIGAAQEARRGARYYHRFDEKWRHRIWVTYHIGIIALLGGLGLALAPRPGGAQEGLRWAASYVAFFACAVEFVISVWVVFTRD